MERDFGRRRTLVLRKFWGWGLWSRVNIKQLSSSYIDESPHLNHIHEL